MTVTSGADASMQQLYQQIILDHAKRRVGYGLLGGPDDGSVDGDSHQKNPVCGDEVELQVRLALGSGVEDSGAGGDGSVPRVAEIGWEGTGCSISQASLSVMNELLVGRTLPEIAGLEDDFHQLMHSRGKGIDDAAADRLEDASAFVGVAKFPARIKCALLGWSAVRDAVTTALSKDPYTELADTYRPAS